MQAFVLITSSEASFEFFGNYIYNPICSPAKKLLSAAGKN